MFVKNCWYVAAFPEEVTQQAPLGRVLLGEPVVLFRLGDGKVAALENRCCHRGVPLDQGLVEPAGLRCGYHGLLYDQAGRCVEVPGQERIPAKAAVRAYPVVEKDRLIWIWLGEAEAADPARILDYPFHDHPAWGHRGALTPVKANYQLIHDNLLDLSHVGYVHRRTIGGNPATHMTAETTTTREGDAVRVERWMMNSAPPPTYVAAFGFKGAIDRWQEIDFRPGVLRIFTGGADAGTGAREGRRDHGFGMRGLHCITPETQHTSHYFWTMATNALAEVDLVYRQTADTFDEDKMLIELQYANLQRDPARPLVDVNADAGGIQARRILARLLAQEYPPGAAA